MTNLSKSYLYFTLIAGAILSNMFHEVRAGWQPTKKEAEWMKAHEANSKYNKPCEKGNLEACHELQRICEEKKGQLAADACYDLAIVKFSSGDQIRAVQLMKRGCDLGYDNACTWYPIYKKKLEESLGL